jgi:hypothetical protein
MRQSLSSSPVLKIGLGTYEFRLVDHGREDEFWTADTFVECSAMEFLSGRRGR